MVTLRDRLEAEFPAGMVVDRAGRSWDVVGWTDYDCLLVSMPGHPDRVLFVHADVFRRPGPVNRDENAENPQGPRDTQKVVM